MRYHGKYCGPGWSEGKHQPSVVGQVVGDDDFDESCRKHDANYAINADLASADYDFYSENVGRGAKRTAAALAVGLQGFLRAPDKYLPTFFTEEMNRNPRLRGAVTPNQKLQINPKQKQNNVPNGKVANMSISRATPPVSIGTQISSMKPKLQRTNESARLVGNDFIGTVEGQGVSTFGLGKSALLSPAYFASTVLGNLARSFEKYRWNKLRVHYVPKVSTATVGQIVMCSQRSVSEPGLQPESGTFLPRAMSQGNAVFSPLWQPAAIDIDCNGDWKLVDPAISSDLDDSIHEELQVYTQISSTAQVGYLFAEYDISFQEPIYQPHSTNMPIFTGPGVRCTMIDGAAVNANGDDWTLTEGTTNLGLSTLPNGTILRAVFDLQGSSPATGITFATGYGSRVFFHDTATTFANGIVTTVPFVGGTTFYIVLSSGSICRVYTSIEAAITGLGSGQLFYTGATTVVGAYSCDVTLVRYGIATLASVQ